MKIREMTCILCPMGCTLSVTVTDEGLVSVSGNQCPRGAGYAESEMTHPMRTLTTTVRCADGSVLAVRTKEPIPKEAVLPAMKVLNRFRLSKRVTFGDVILPDLLDTGVSVVACGIWKPRD